MYTENSKKVIRLDSFSKQIKNIWVFFRHISVFETTTLLNMSVHSSFLWLLLLYLIGSLMRQRNRVTKLKKTSMRVYFFERCAGGPKSKDFWPTIKPFLS